jgi:lipoprotein-anchoring transpeptidase ErfK/SrfK
MPLRSHVRSIAFASLAAIATLAAPTTAGAQGLIDFLWGGTSEWGGGRQTVAFDPKYTPGQIIVSFGDRRLYHITAKGRATSYPIAIPREQSRWQGTTAVSAKRENPSWRPTAEMLQENPKLPSWVPGGHRMNPLGVRALYLGSSTYRIHGTDAPWTIGQNVSKGCIRMYNEDVLDLYPRVPVGTRVTVTWERFNTQYVASDANTDSGPASYALSGYKQPTARRQIRELPPPLPAAEDVGEAQTQAVRAAFTRPAPATALTDEEPAVSEKKAAKHDKPAKDKKQAEPKDSAPVAQQPATDKLPAVAAVAATEKKPKPQQPAEAAAGASSAAAADAAQRAAAAAAKAAEAARKAAEAARKAAEDAKRATSSVTGASKESPAPTATRASL